MGIQRREFPCQPRESGEDTTGNATLELMIKERMEIQKERI